jgi:hypothetical protein
MSNERVLKGEIYTLPDISFVGGATQKYRFLLKGDDGQPFSIAGASVDFSIIDYTNKNGEPILSVTPEILADGNGVACILYVVIDSSDTRDLYGKYIYQITIIDVSQNVGIPNQGIMTVTRNINREFIE